MVSGRSSRLVAATVLLQLRCAAPAAVCTGSFALAADLATSAGTVRCLEFVTSNNLLAAGGEDKVLRVWTLNPLSTTPNSLHGHDGGIMALEWIADHGLLASGSRDGTIRFWPLSVLSAAQACSGIESCCDGSGLGCHGNHVVSWREAGMSKSATVHSLLWISSESRLVSGWSDGGIRIWSYSGANTYPSWTLVSTLTSPDRVYKMAWLSGSSTLAAVSPDWSHPRLWSGLSSGTFMDLGDRGYRQVCPWTSHCDGATDVAKDFAETRVVTSSKDNCLIVWDTATTSRQAKLTGHTDYVTAVAWLQSETKIASGGKDNSVRVWDDTGSDQSSASQTLSGHTGQVNALAWDSAVSSGQLASCGSDGYVKLWTCTR